MNAEVRAVCREAVSSGFLLAGVPVTTVEHPGELGVAMRHLLDRPEVGVVLIESALHEALPDDVRRRLSRQPLPMVVPFPGPAWEARPEGAEAYIVELLRQVIGYRVRLR